MFVIIVLTTVALHTKKSHTPAFDKPDHFVKNTVNPVRQPSGKQSVELIGAPEPHFLIISTFLIICFLFLFLLTYHKSPLTLQK